MRIVLDAMGSDNNPDPEIQASVEAARQFNDEIILVGSEDLLSPRLKDLGGEGLSIRLVDAPDTITMNDKGLQLALKAKRKGSKTSMAVGMDLLKNGQADVFVSAGNTGGVLATAFYRLGMIPGVERPAVTGLFPVKGGSCVVLDLGANPECKPEWLLQFAHMGSVYTENMRQVSQPRVGLLSNGEEPGKGNELVKATFPLLEKSRLNFIGNVESKEIYAGRVDVVVTDGFSGNIFLKTTEAVAKLVSEMLRQELMQSTRTKIGALMAKPAFDRLKRRMDPGEIGAAPLLGIDGLVFKAHGRSDARALFNAIRTARQAVETRLLAALHETIQERQTSVDLQEVV